MPRLNTPIIRRFHCIVFFTQDKSLVIQSQKSVNISSGGSRMSLSPDELTVTTPTFSVYTHDPASSSAGDQLPVLAVTNQSITVSADSLQVYTLASAAKFKYSGTEEWTTSLPLFAPYL